MQGTGSKPSPDPFHRIPLRPLSLPLHPFFSGGVFPLGENSRTMASASRAVKTGSEISPAARIDASMSWVILKRVRRQWAESVARRVEIAKAATTGDLEKILWPAPPVPGTVDAIDDGTRPPDAEPNEDPEPPAEPPEDPPAEPQPESPAPPDKQP